MDKAPDFGSGDCRFESCHARLRKNFCRSVEISALYATFVIVAFVNANGPRRQGRLCGATVARLTPDQKAACSNHVRFMGSEATFLFGSNSVHSFRLSRLSSLPFECSLETGFSRGPVKVADKYVIFFRVRVGDFGFR